MNAEEFLARLSIKKEEINGHRDGGYFIVLLDGGDQIATQDGPGEMSIDFSDEQLLENCELEEEDVRELQKHQDAVVTWITAQGFKVILGYDP